MPLHEPTSRGRSLRIPVPLPPARVADRVRAVVEREPRGDEKPGYFTGAVTGTEFAIVWSQIAQSRMRTTYVPMYNVNGRIEPDGEGSLVVASIRQRGGNSLILSVVAFILAIAILTGFDLHKSIGTAPVVLLSMVAGALIWYANGKVGVRLLRPYLMELVGAPVAAREPGT